MEVWGRIWGRIRSLPAEAGFHRELPVKNRYVPGILLCHGKEVASGEHAGICARIVVSGTHLS
jgi:hypothetical protein